jgi:UDPglucose--hexose-1-phosphate uridylyltransferase
MSEFRQDIVSGDWIIIAPVRSKRPQNFKEKAVRKIKSKSVCPFDNLQKSGNWPPLNSWPDLKKWKLIVIPNKFPILSHSEKCGVKTPRGPYFMEEGVGHHDLIVTRNHHAPLYKLPEKDMTALLGIIQEQIGVYSKDRCLAYVSTFMNVGPKAGASLDHPHLQLLATPIIPPDVSHSLHGAKRYYEKNNRCAHCEIIKYERAENSRIIAENISAIALAPFASRSPFEIRIFPRRHNPSFEKITAKERKGVGELLQKTLKVIADELGNPDMNFFIHSAPIKERSNYRYYHWHIEILPILKINGGLELSTGVQVNSMPPEEVVNFLRPKGKK